MTTSPRPATTLPGTATQDTEEGAAAGLGARIVLAGTVVFGQLWALVAGLDRYLLGHRGQAWILFGLSALSFLVVIAVVVVEPASRRDLRRQGHASTQSGGLYRPEPLPERPPGQPAS
jgi:hypothetical protein